MKVIGITGSIGTGKTLAGNFFKEKGYVVLDADYINHQLLKEKEVIKKVNELVFGIKSEKLDKTKVAAVIFSNKEIKANLESYLHPLILKEINSQIAVLNEKVVFIVVPLLFEAKFNLICDYVLFVYADMDKQIKRIQKRDNLSEKEIKMRIESQMPSKEKALLSNYVIDNNQTEKQTINQLKRWLKDYKRRLKHGNL